MAEMGFTTTPRKASLIDVPLNEFKHALFLGKTGNGKTTGGINPIIDSRIGNGYGMLIFDEKGKEHRVVKAIAERHGRLNDVVELGKPHGISVNLMDNLSERQLESFIRRFLKRSKESFWEEGAVNIFMSLTKWLMGIKKLYRFGIETFDMKPLELRLTHKEGKSDKTYEWMVSPDPLSAKEMSNYFHDPVAFALVSQKSENYVAMLIEHLLESMHVNHLKRKGLNDQILVAEKLIDELKELQTVLKGKMIKADLSESSGNNGTYFMISSVINILGQDRYVNNPHAESIASLLNQGKVVIINTESFSTPILSSLLDQTLESLSTRSKHKNIHPISVIIDEANRVLSADSDIRIDVLRESKVEVIMATQNHEQMITKMGEERWLSFVQNFNTRYHFLGMGESEKFKVMNELNDREFEAVPMFFREEDLDHIEWIYQSNHKFYDRYLKNTNDKSIAIYEHGLFEKEEKIILYNLVDQSMSFTTIYPTEANVKSTVFRDRIKELKNNRLFGIAL